ncbi:metal-dependent transcriptional regulator [Lacticaseibacillus saniviri]|nr:metal-dependent transcriptional regulator [Lacticaseibacillus saniviri]MCG4280843.1 metal-dependent transcriptional regulator [Lacticaseibacillus saniviri]
MKRGKLGLPEYFWGDWVRNSRDNYLKAIFECSQITGTTRNKAISDELHIAPGSVSEAIANLVTAKLITRHIYGTVALTPYGFATATVLMRHYYLLEVWLDRMLHYPLPLIPELAWNMGDIDEDFAAQLDIYLGHPELNPFGHPIMPLKLEEPAFNRLIDVKADSTFTIVSFVESATMLNYLDKLGIPLNAALDVVQTTPLVCEAEATGKQYILDATMAQDIFVHTPICV